MADIRTYERDGARIHVMDCPISGVFVYNLGIGVLRGPEFPDDMAAIDWALNLSLREYLVRQKREAKL